MGRFGGKAQRGHDGRVVRKALPPRIPNPTIKGSVGNLEIVRASVSSIIPFVKLRGTLELWVLLFVRLLRLL